MCGANRVATANGSQICEDCPAGRFLEDGAQVDASLHDSLDDCLCGLPYTDDCDRCVSTYYMSQRGDCLPCVEGMTCIDPDRTRPGVTVTSIELETNGLWYRYVSLYRDR